MCSRRRRGRRRRAPTNKKVRIYGAFYAAIIIIIFSIGTCTVLCFVVLSCKLSSKVEQHESTRGNYIAISLLLIVVVDDV